MNLLTWYSLADQRRMMLEGWEPTNNLFAQLVTISWYYSNSPWCHPTIVIGRVSCLGTAALRLEGTVDEGDCLAGEVCGQPQVSLLVCVVVACSQHPWVQAIARDGSRAVYPENVEAAHGRVGNSELLG